MIALQLCPSPGAKYSEYDVTNPINWLTAGKSYPDPVLFNVVVCYTGIFKYTMCQISNRVVTESTVKMTQ